MKTFKDMAPGFFRASDHICYTKLTDVVKIEEQSYNAVCITSGKLSFFEDEAPIEDFEGE